MAQLYFDVENYSKAEEYIVKSKSFKEDSCESNEHLLRIQSLHIKIVKATKQDAKLKNLVQERLQFGLIGL